MKTKMKRIGISKCYVNIEMKVIIFKKKNLTIKMKNWETITEEKRAAQLELHPL